MNALMNSIKLPLMAGALLAAFAAPAAALPAGELAVDQSLKQDVRLICHAYGRCYEVHRRVYEEPGYYRSYGWGPDYDYGGPYYGGPSVGFSFGFGGGHHHW
jgi:hypothetical protein